MGLWVVLAMVDLGLLLVLALDPLVLALDCLDCLGRIHLLRQGAMDYLVIRFIMRL